MLMLNSVTERQLSDLGHVCHWFRSCFETLKHVIVPDLSVPYGAYPIVHPFDLAVKCTQQQHNMLTSFVASVTQ